MIVPSPNFTRRDLFAPLLDTGVHILCEGPLATSIRGFALDVTSQPAGRTLTEAGLRPLSGLITCVSDASCGAAGAPEGGMGYIVATAVAMLVSTGHSARTDHIPNYDLGTMRMMSVVTGRCLKTTRVAQPSGTTSPRILRRRTRCSVAHVVFGGPTRFGDVTISFAAPNHAADRAFAVMGTMKDAWTLEIQAALFGTRAAERAIGTCVARAAKGFRPPPKGDAAGGLSVEEVAAQMDEAGAPEDPLDISCHVIDPGTGHSIADIAFRQQRSAGKRR